MHANETRGTTQFMREALDILQQDGPMTLRQLFWRLASAGEIHNFVENYHRLEKIMASLCADGHCPFGLIVVERADGDGGNGGNELSGEGWEQVARLARRGFRLFPCRPRSKHPAIKEWQHKATCDLVQLGKWFEKFEACNWAIATGKVSQNFVLDVDGPEGLHSFADCCEQAGVDWKTIAEATLGVKTGRGSHLYFAHPDHVVRNSSKRLAPGLDIRGDGGYCVAPPSVHENSEPYFWLGRDEGKPITTAPVWLLERVSALDCQSAKCQQNRGECG